jgi:hypothetical protein
MCIYCTTNNYRKIYENHNGIIPKDSDGRTYEIHHIDGNHKRRIEAGEHNFQTLRICPHCDKSGKGEVMFRWHFDNCKQKK